MTAEMLVKSKVEDPDMLIARRQISQSKSIHELSQISSFSEFPVPGTLKRIWSKSKQDMSDENSGRLSIQSLLISLMMF